MQRTHFLRGMATVNFWADNVAAARDWHTELFGERPTQLQIIGAAICLVGLEVMNFRGGA
ncbi:MAG: hypothetical protein SH847_03705 [Roseiflexaceae bacterium]|nr:hypothetical protein [Roseiflexaceae bacterium]